MEKDCHSGPKQVLQYLRLLVTVKHQDSVLGARKAITGLINANLNFIKMVSLYSWETAKGPASGPTNNEGMPCEDLHPSVYCQPQLLSAEMPSGTSQPD